MSDSWKTHMLEMFDRWLELYRSGQTDWTTLAAPGDEDVLEMIGCKPREFFDYVEDHANHGEPDKGTVIDITDLRWDYYLTVQGGEPSTKVITPESLPAKGEEFQGIPWLPRLIAKAEGKLRGELHPDIMYGCPGDMAFFKRHGLDPVEFLQLVWDCEGDRDNIADHVIAAGS
ncbi:MAG: DUF5069 domain-containing protein [Verrucomicrobia bacterium]|nr:DUF5069 domain-containing protein [Verrucomicrobiota bacterium]